MIQVDTLCKSFGSLQAVRGISLDVQDGELFGFLGPNGAGKTTTLSMIAGLLTPDAGTVRIDEYDVWKSPVEAKKRLGLVPQDLALYHDLSATENMRFWGGLYPISKTELKTRIAELLERIGLADRANEPVKNFSGGMKRRLNLAIGLVHQPKFILLDEPTVGIDPQSRNAIMEIIREIAAEGATILYTTHHLNEVEALCDRIAIMDNGSILQTGTMNQLAGVVGDRDLITVRGDFSAGAIREAFTEAEVTFLSVEDNQATCSLGSDSFSLQAFLHRLEERSIVMNDLSMQKPSLESVFLKLTGRELRD